MPTVRRAAKSAPQTVVALDLGGTKLASCLFTQLGKPSAVKTIQLEQRQGAAVGELVAGEARSWARKAARCGSRVRAVGVCVPGIVRAQTGRVWAPNIPDWEDYPLRAQIADALADPQIDVVIESDRAASILGEVWQGVAHGCRNAIFLAVGTGIGAGILVDGQVLRGAQDIAGAVGWLALDRPYRSEYARYGCFESHASGEGIAKVAQAVLSRLETYRGPLRTQPIITAHEVFAAYEQADEVAEEVLAEAIEFWGMASANLVSLLNPEMIIFGGGVFGPANRFLKGIAAEARRWAQPVAIEHVKIESTQLGGDAALYGAAYVALRRAGLPLA